MTTRTQVDPLPLLVVGWSPRCEILTEFPPGSDG